MSLYIVATPIGNADDITLRALEILKSAQIIIGEERSVCSKLLKKYGIEGKTIELLNEHSTNTEIEALLTLCKSQTCALVSDAGTPVFCDPGSHLIKLCREAGVEVKPAPGASSLMTLLSLVSQRLNRFVFEGFLPAERQERENRLKSLAENRSAYVVLDTPYRLDRTISDLARIHPNRKALLGLNLTQPDEKIVEMNLRQLVGFASGKKAEFIVLVYPERS